MIDFNINDIVRLTQTFDIGPTGNKFIDSRYQEHIDKFGHAEPYYRFFYCLSRYLKPNVIVELGSYQGTAAAHFSIGNPEALVITVDHHSDPGDDINQRKTIEAVSHCPNIKYIQGWTTDRVAEEQRGKHQLGDSPSAYKQVLNYLFVDNLTIDILFIDGWHHYSYAMEDWEAYRPLLSRPALVICDDIMGVEADTISGMLKFWNELPGEKYLEKENLHSGGGNNIGILKYNEII